MRSFDQLLGELVEDGYIRVEGQEHRQLVPTEVEPQSDYSHLVYPNRA